MHNLRVQTRGPSLLRITTHYHHKFTSSISSCCTRVYHASASSNKAVAAAEERNEFVIAPKPSLLSLQYILNTMKDPSISVATKISLWRHAFENSLVSEREALTQFMILSQPLSDEQFDEYLNEVFNDQIRQKCKHRELNTLNILYPAISTYMKENKWSRVRSLFKLLHVTRTYLSSVHARLILTNALRKEPAFFDHVFKIAKTTVAWSPDDLRVIFFELVCAGDVERAMRLFRFILRRGVVVHPAVYCALLREIKKRMNVYNMRKVYIQYSYELINEIEKNGRFPTNTRGYLSILSFLALVGDLTGTMKWFQRLIDSKVRVNDKCLSCVVRALSEAYKIEEALQFTREVQQKYGLPPNSYMFATIIDGYVRQKKLTQAMAVFDEMVNDHQIPPNAVVLNTLFMYYVNGKQVDQAMQIFDSMKKYNVDPLITTFNLLIKMLSEVSVQSMYSLVSDMITKHNMSPDAFTISLMLNACSNPTQLEIILKLISDYKIAAEHRIQQRILELHCNFKQVDQALSLYESMKAQENVEMKPNVGTLRQIARVVGRHFVYKELVKMKLVPYGALFADGIDTRKRRVAGTILGDATSVNRLYTYHRGIFGALLQLLQSRLEVKFDKYIAEAVELMKACDKRRGIDKVQRATGITSK